MKIVAVMLIMVLAMPLSNAASYTIGIDHNELEKKDVFNRFVYIGTSETTQISDPITQINFGLTDPPFNSSNIREVFISNAMEYKFEDGKTIATTDVFVNHTVDWNFDLSSSFDIWIYCNKQIRATATVDGMQKADLVWQVPKFMCFNSGTSTIIITYQSVLVGNITENIGFTFVGNVQFTTSDRQIAVDYRISSPHYDASFVIGNLYTNFFSPAPSLTILTSATIIRGFVDYRILTQEAVTQLGEDECFNPPSSFTVSGATVRASCIIKHALQAVVNALINGIGFILSKFLSAIGIDVNLQNNMLVALKLTLFLLTLSITILFTKPLELWLIYIWWVFLLGIMEYTSTSEAPITTPFKNVFRVVKNTAKAPFRIWQWIASRFQRSPDVGGNE